MWSHQNFCLPNKQKNVQMQRVYLTVTSFLIILRSSVFAACAHFLSLWPHFKISWLYLLTHLQLNKPWCLLFSGLSFSSPSAWIQQKLTNTLNNAFLLKKHNISHSSSPRGRKIGEVLKLQRFNIVHATKRLARVVMIFCLNMPSVSSLSNSTWFWCFIFFLHWS